MLDMHVIQPTPPAMEPPVVSRMAAQAGLGAPPAELSTGWKVLLIGGAFGLMSLAYLDCVRRGACHGFWKRI